jgi:hypothetical protein
LSSAFLQPIFLALISLNSSSYPAMRDAGIATFTFAASYAATRQVGAEVDIVHQSEVTGRTTCHTQFQAPSVVLMCSPGYIADSDHAVEVRCRQQGLPCPHGLECVCRPCIPLLPTNVFPWQVQAHTYPLALSFILVTRIHASSDTFCAGGAGAVHCTLCGRVGSDRRVEGHSRLGCPGR